MPSSWSSRISDRYRCQLPVQLADWFDRELWKQQGATEFNSPADPTELLSSAPEAIWPGLMCADFLPILGNSDGDWICARFGPDDEVVEFVQWFHGGGDWIPWGNDLAHAVLFDAARARLPGPSSRHAIPAEQTDDVQASCADCSLVSWALTHVPELKSTFEVTQDSQQLAQLLIENSVAEAAVRCELISDALTNPQHALLEHLLWEQFKATAPQIAEWCFDNDRIPPEIRAPIIERGISLDVQDWESAESNARCVTQTSPELAWGWDILGYAAQRRGDMQAAAAAFERGSSCSVFTDQSVRLKTHWATEEFGKFSMNGLVQSAPEVIANTEYLQILQSTNRHEATMKHWQQQGTKFHDQGHFHEAHRCFMLAAWDVGAGPIDVFSQLLKQIADNAQHSNQNARAELAQTHLRCFRERYGL